MRKNLRTRLTVYFISLALVPLLIVGLMVAYQTFSTQSVQALEVQSQNAKRIARQVENYIQTRENELLAAVDAVGLVDEREEQVNLLTGLLASQKVYNDLMLIDGQGREQLFLSKNEMQTGRALGNRADSPEFEQPKETGEAYLGPVAFDDRTAEPLMLISVPLFDLRTGELQYVLVANFRFKPVWELFAQADLKGKGTVYLTDLDNHVIAHPNPSVVLRGTQATPPFDETVTTGLDGTQVVRAYQHIVLNQQEFNVIAEQPRSEALSLAITNLGITAGALVVFMFLAGLFGILSARQITEPIDRLVATAQMISEGDLSRQARVTSQDEIGALAIAFNSMTSQLKETIEALNQRIIEQAKTQDALHASEAHLRTLIHTIPDLVWLKDPNGVYLSCNSRFESFFGAKEVDIVGKTDYDFVDKELADFFRGNDKAVMAANKPLLNEEQVTFADDGHMELLETFKTPMYDSEGRLVGVLGIGRNITERKRAEAERETLISELENKNTELTQFTYTVSHDLKSPLVTINGYLGYIEQDAASGNMDRLKKDTQRIQEAVKKMHTLLSELLELSRIGRMMNEPEDIPFADIVKDALDIVHGRLEAHNITVQTQPNLPTVHGDRQRLTEVLQNLLDNAAKYMGDQPSPLIEIGQHGQEDGKPIFFVKDNGIGIAVEYHERIFGLFNKLNVHSEGTGIGLTLVRRIIEVHGGRIWVESALSPQEEAESGSIFYFTLPQA